VNSSHTQTYCERDIYAEPHSLSGTAERQFPRQPKLYTNSYLFYSQPTPEERSSIARSQIARRKS